MKNEEFRIFSVKYVLRVIRFGLKSLNEELEESLTMKLNMKSLIKELEENLTMKLNIKYYSSDDNMHAF